MNGLMLKKHGDLEKCLNMWRDEVISFQCCCFFCLWWPTWSTRGISRRNRNTQVSQAVTYYYYYTSPAIADVYIFEFPPRCCRCLDRALSSIGVCMIYVGLEDCTLTLMRLFANLAITKWCKKTENWLKPWHMVPHLRVLSKSYPLNTNVTGFRWFKKIFASFCFGISLCIGRVKPFASGAYRMVRHTWKYLKNKSALWEMWTLMLLVANFVYT